MRVLKYTLHEHGEALVPLPRGSRVIAVGDQCGALQLWAEVADGMPLQSRRFAVLFTGFDEVPYRATFIGTVLSSNGSIVRHVYEIGEDD